MDERTQVWKVQYRIAGKWHVVETPFRYEEAAENHADLLRDLDITDSVSTYPYSPSQSERQYLDRRAERGADV